MTYLSRQKIYSNQMRFFVKALAVCFALVMGFAVTANANESSIPKKPSHPTKKCNGCGSGVGVGIGIGIGVNTLIDQVNKNKKKPKKKKATTKKKPKKKKVTKKKKQKAKKKAVVAVAPVVPKYRNNHILGVFLSGVLDEIVGDVAADFGLEILGDSEIQLIDARVVKFRIRRRMSPLRALELANDPRVVSAQPNYLYQMAASSVVQYAINKMDINKAHEMNRGQGATIAVIDSGVRTSHPALSAAVIDQFDATGKRGRRDFSHGTGIASIIGARDGMIGIAPDAQILSAIVFAKDKKRGPSMAETFDILRSVDWAVGKNARILNMSFSGARDPAFHAVLTAAYQAGVISVAAAGNLGSKAPPAYPAAYPEVIAVTATDAKDRLYKHANTGEYVTVAAPGVDVLVARRKKSYGLMSGTSAATSYVSGALALLVNQRPEMDTDSAIDFLAATARDLGDKGRDSKFGFGLLNAYDVLTADAPEKPDYKYPSADVSPASVETGAVEQAQ
jgi:subtilisin family serine protease